MKSAVSVMEEKAKQYPLLQPSPKFNMLPPPEKVKEEIGSLHSILPLLSKELAEARRVVKEKERQFFLLANYKYFLEKTLVTPTIYSVKSPPPRERSKADLLLEKLNSLTPQQREFLKTVEVGQ